MFCYFDFFQGRNSNCVLQRKIGRGIKFFKFASQTLDLKPKKIGKQLLNGKLACLKETYGQLAGFGVSTLTGACFPCES